MSSALPVSGGYIFDTSTLSLLGSGGSQLARHIVSGLLVEAIDGSGPPIRIPAVCLLAATARTPRLAEHLAQIVVAAPDGAVDVAELGMITVAQMATLTSTAPHAPFDVWHAAYETRAHRGWTLLTTQSDAYRPWRELHIYRLAG